MSNKIMSVGKDKIVPKVKNIAKLMNYYFINITRTLNLKSSRNSNSNDIMELLSKFNDHSSIKK